MINFPFFQGRALSRAKSRRNLDYTDVLRSLEEKGISIRVASPKLVMEEVSIFLFIILKHVNDVLLPYCVVTHCLEF